MGAEKVIVQRQPIHASAAHVYGGAYITTSVWQHWEIRRYLNSVNPKFGYFSSCGAAK